MAPHVAYSTVDFVRDIYRSITPYKFKFFTGVFFRATSDIAELYPVWAISVIVPLLTAPFIENVIQQLLLLLAGWLFTALYAGFAHDFSKYLGNQVAEAAGLDMYKKTLGHVFRLDLAWQELEGSGNKMKRIDHGRDGINQTIRRIFNLLIQAIVNTVGIVILFFSLKIELSISLIFFIVTYFILGNILIKRPSRQERYVNILSEAFSGITFESLNNIRTIKALGIDSGIFQVVKKQSAVLVDEIRKRILYFRIQSGILSTYYFLFEFVMVAFIIWNIIQGNYTVSILILFVGMYMRVGESTSELTEFAQEIVVNKIWVSRAMDLLRVTPSIENPHTEHTMKDYPARNSVRKSVSVSIAFSPSHGLAP